MKTTPSGPDPTGAFPGAFERLLRWSALAAALNLAWELAQLPLYTIYEQGDVRTIAFAIGHCTAGDVLIAASSYVVAAATTRSWAWPATRPVLGATAVVVAGVAYTAFSEWLNVSVRGSWAYADAMPRIFGTIGLAPLAQWLVVPLLTLAFFRTWTRHAGR